MNVLLITNDLNVLRENTPARAAVEHYATFTKHLVVVVLNTSRDRYRAQKVSESLLLLPTNAYASIFAPLKAYQHIIHQLYFQGRLQVDLVVAGDPLLAGFVGWFTSARFHRPLLIELRMNVLSRNYASQSFAHTLRSMVGRFLVRRSHGLIIYSEGIRATLADISTSIADRAMRAPHFMDIEAFQKEPLHVDLAAKYPQFKTILLTVAPLEKVSNLQLAIKVLAGVVALYPDTGLVIVGEGSLYRKLKAYARKTGMAEHVIFEPKTDNISSYYKSARFFLMTALYEGYDDPLAYAAAASCAIVSTAVGIAPAIIEDGISGFLCEPHDTAKLVTSITTMIRKPSLCDSVRLNANLSIQKYMDSDEKTYIEFSRQAWEQTIKEASKEAESV